MTYELSRQALRELGRDARFEDDIGHYNFRRQATNKVNYILPVKLFSIQRMYPAMMTEIFLYLIYSQGISRARNGKGCLASPATRFSKSTTNHNSLRATSSMSSFFDRLRTVYYVSLEACLGKGIYQHYPILPTRTSVLYTNTQKSYSLGERRESLQRRYDPLPALLRTPESRFYTSIKGTKPSKKTQPNFGKPWQLTLARELERTISRMHLCLKSTDRSINFSANLILKDIMLIVLPMRIRSYLSLRMCFLNGHALWKTLTVKTQRTLTRTSYLHVVSRLQGHCSVARTLRTEQARQPYQLGS